MGKAFILISNTVKLEEQWKGLLKRCKNWAVYKLEDGCWIYKGAFFANKSATKAKLKKQAFRALGIIDENKDQPRTARKIRALEFKKD